MRTLTEPEIRASFVNTTKSERTKLTLPTNVDDVTFGELDYLGWRDAKVPNVSYIVADVDGVAIGLLLRQTDTRPRSRAQCSWCSDVQLPNGVVFYAAKRAGDAGRRGDTVGTLICENFECSQNVRKLPPSAYLGFDREAARDRRVDLLRQRVDGFVRDVRGDR